VEDSATSQGSPYHDAINPTNYEAVTSTRLRSTGSTCSSADQQTLTMSSSLSGLLFTVNSQLGLKRSFSFGIWVQMSSITAADILNVLDVAWVRSDGTKLTLSATFADGTVEAVSSSGGATACQAGKWCYVAGSVQLLDQKYYLHLYELSVDTATKASSSKWQTSAGASFKPLKAFSGRLVGLVHQVVGGSLEVPYQQSFEGAFKGLKLFGRHLHRHFLLSDGFTLNEKYGLQPLLLVHIRASQNQVLDFGRFPANFSASLAARVADAAGLPPLCDRRYVFDCVGLPDSALLSVVADNRHLLRHHRYVSQFSHPNIVQWRAGDRLVFSRESCANQTAVSCTFAATNALPADASQLLAGIGTGHHRVCGFFDSLGEFALLGTVYSERLHTVDVSLLDVLFDTSTPTQIAFAVKEHSTVNVGDRLYLAKSCEELDAKTDPQLASEYISFEKTSAASFTPTHAFSLADAPKNLFKSLEACLLPRYSSASSR